MQPDVDAWDPWLPQTMAERLDGVAFPWFVAGGWALDLFRGATTRDHEDLEIALPAGTFPQLTPLFPDMVFWVPQGEGRLAPMTPVTLAGESHQTWAWDRTAGSWRFDVFREPHDGHTWICRRDAQIRLPYPEIVRRTADGVPYLVPEIVLLFKAKAVRRKDAADFDGVLPLLTAAQRAWLDGALGVVHPDHPWRARLRD
jgi:hypothetical protein